MVKSYALMLSQQRQVAGVRCRHRRVEKKLVFGHVGCFEGKLVH